jgi:hypothetical protein
VTNSDHLDLRSSSGAARKRWINAIAVAGGVGAADDDHLAVTVERRLAGRRPVEDTGADQALDVLGLAPAVMDTCGDDAVRVRMAAPLVKLHARDGGTQPLPARS